MRAPLTLLALTLCLGCGTTREEVREAREEVILPADGVEIERDLASGVPPEFVPALEAIRLSLADGDETTARRTLGFLLGRRPEGRTLELARGFERILDGRERTEWLDLRLEAVERPAEPAVYDLRLILAQHGPESLLLRAGGARPHLVVAACAERGVRLAFDSNWLEHEGFRASVPMRCALSGADDRGRLVARPLAFVDRSHGAARSASEIEARYEQPVGSSRSMRELAGRMGVCDHIDKPFNLAMPYCVDAQLGHESLRCTTHTRDDGGVTCEVLVPSGPCALAWLANVNGICGDDYEMLRQEVSLMHSDAWRNLPEQTRERIGAWVSLEGGERFRHYVNDADFGQRDAGLAGLVCTDRRLVFKKYHHQGQIGLASEGIVILRRDDEFTHVTIQSMGQRSRVGKFRRSDLRPLIDVIERAPNLKVERH